MRDICAARISETPMQYPSAPVLILPRPQGCFYCRVLCTSVFALRVSEAGPSPVLVALRALGTRCACPNYTSLLFCTTSERTNLGAHVNRLCGIYAGTVVHRSIDPTHSRVRITRIYTVDTDSQDICNVVVDRGAFGIYTTFSIFPAHPTRHDIIRCTPRISLRDGPWCDDDDATIKRAAPLELRRVVFNTAFFFFFFDRVTNLRPSSPNVNIILRL
jgi:hypothetical protein